MKSKLIVAGLIASCITSSALAKEWFSPSYDDLPFEPGDTIAIEETLQDITQRALQCGVHEAVSFSFMGIWSGDILDLSDPAETVDLLEVEGYSGLTLYFQQQALLEGCLYNSFIRSSMLMCPEWLKQLTQQSSN